MPKRSKAARQFAAHGSTRSRGVDALLVRRRAPRLPSARPCRSGSACRGPSSAGGARSRRRRSPRRANAAPGRARIEDRGGQVVASRGLGLSASPLRPVQLLADLLRREATGRRRSPRPRRSVWDCRTGRCVAFRGSARARRAGCRRWPRPAGELRSSSGSSVVARWSARRGAGTAAGCDLVGFLRQARS